MKKELFVGLAAGALMFGINSAAMATIIDFEDQGVASGSQWNVPFYTSITSGGFNFSPGPNFIDVPDMHVSNNNWNTIGHTTELLVHGDLISMNSGGATFSLQSFDFGSHFSEVPFSVIGTYSGGATTVASFNLDGNIATFETFSLDASFVNLTKVEWLHQGGIQGIFNIDNIVVNSSQPVPEPATMLLFGTGIAGLAGSRLRRKRP